MLELLDQADADGLVLQPENTKSPLFICCCCGCCCGVLTSAKRFPTPAEYFSTNYYAEVDQETCQSCGACISRCQMDAISNPEGPAQVDRKRCIPRPNSEHYGAEVDFLFCQRTANDQRTASTWACGLLPGFTNLAVAGVLALSVRWLT